MQRKAGRPVLVVAVAAGVLLALLAGCGSDSSTPDALKKPAFVQQANAICVTARDGREQASKDLVENDETEAAAATDALVSPVKAMVKELGDLGAPKGDQKRVDEIVAAFEAGVAEVEEDPEAAGLASAFARADELASAYGLSECTI